MFLFPGRMKSTTALSNNSTMGHRLILQNDEENMKTPDHSVVDAEHRYWSHINRWTNFSTTIYLQFFVRIFCNVRFQSYLSRFYNSQQFRFCRVKAPLHMHHMKLFYVAKCNITWIVILCNCDWRLIIRTKHVTKKTYSY